MFRLDHACFETQSTDKTHTFNYAIYEKRSHRVEGIAYMCMKTRIELFTWLNWYGKEEHDRYVIQEEVSKAECEYMVATHKCGTDLMTCYETHCFWTKEPIAGYSYFETKKAVTYHCQVNKKQISSKELDTPLIIEGNKCETHKFYCRISPATYIWPKDVIHQCQFRPIRNINLNVSGKIAVSSKEKLLFQLIETINDASCNLTIAKTSEGLYLSETATKNNLGDPQDIDLKRYMLLADEDFRSFEIFKLLTKINERNDERCCQTLKLVISLF